MPAENPRTTARLQVPLHGASSAALGSARFQREFGVSLNYVAGAMYKGIASSDLVVAMGRAHLLAYFGAGGLSFEEVIPQVRRIQTSLNRGEPYGVNLLCNLISPAAEERMAALIVECDVPCVEAAAFTQITRSLVWLRLQGARKRHDGGVTFARKIMAKLSRPEVAEAFLLPPPASIVSALYSDGRLTRDEASLAPTVSMVDAICAEADSGGHTDHGVALALIPAMAQLRAKYSGQFRSSRAPFLGAAGGIGTPESVAAAFILGADFVLTGSINQCTVEAGTSDAVKDMLQDAGVQDTTYAPAGDMFELGARVQVLKKGLFFPARANKLHELYQQHDSIDSIDSQTKSQIEDRYFGRSFEEVWRETVEFYSSVRPDVVHEAERNPKRKMALIFRWYFMHTSRLALQGDRERRVDYQIHCGPALGAFNAWVHGTPLASWRNRHVDEIAVRLMAEAAKLWERRYQEFVRNHEERREMA